MYTSSPHVSFPLFFFFSHNLCLLLHKWVSSFMQMGLVILQRFSTSFLRGLHWKHLLVSRRIGDMLVAAAVNIYAAARVGVLKRFFWVTFVVLHDKDFKQLQCSSRTCNSWQSKNDGSAFEQPLQIPVCKLIFFCFQRMLCVLMQKKFTGSVCFLSLLLLSSFGILKKLGAQRIWLLSVHNEYDFGFVSWAFCCCL
jgi:hypothetical protein